MADQPAAVAYQATRLQYNGALTGPVHGPQPDAAGRKEHDKKALQQGATGVLEGLRRRDHGLGIW